MKLAPIPEEEAAAIFKLAQTYSTESIVWLLALCASRGRLPVNTSLDKPVWLKHWPNMTRLQVPPQAARVFSLWSRQGCSLRETLNLLDIPQRHVFALYSACSAIGLIQADAMQQPKPVVTASAPTPQSQHKQGLFRMLIDKLNRYF